MTNGLESAALEYKLECMKKHPGLQERCPEDNAEVRQLMKAMKESKEDEGERLMKREYQQTHYVGGASSSGSQSTAATATQQSAERFMAPSQEAKA